ncbi:N-acetylglucosaminyl transferase component-domain-containing protein [Flagelloscypha sp. PMI_526]|nr:N-acetylglucosaminyl transferase component-domain-containing protein [Flagelloscypha sp. PMI_526]
MSATIVFWPDDIHSGSGFLVGWDTPTICVAGLLDSQTESEAENILTRCKFDWSPCGSSPIILGKCSFDGNEDNLLGLSLTIPNVRSFIPALYTRHSTVSLRYYVLSPPVARTSSVPPSQVPGFMNSHMNRRKGGINDIVMHQFNAAKPLSNSLVALLHDSRPTTQRNMAVVLWRLFDTFTAMIIPLWLGLVTTIVGFCRVKIWPTGLRMKDLSDTLQQTELRLEQTAKLVHELPPLRRREASDVGTFSRLYISFFNTVWLILNDLTIGWATGSFLCENHHVLSIYIHRFFVDSLILWVQWALRWLDSWPAGLKLNTELSWFYSRTLIDLVEIWANCLEHIFFPILPSVLYTMGVISLIGGVTMTISLLSDLLSLMTAHIYLSYLLTNAVYKRALVTSGSLWNLFRGKRYNVLRNRVDSYEYDLDQLLFGTILFTLVAFLFPTALAYYALFAMMRLGTIAIHALMDVQVALLNHFPLFALMLRVKDPWRIPGGMYFDMSTTIPSSTLVVKNQAQSLSFIFFQYIQLWKRLAVHYNPLRLLSCLFVGKTLDPIPRMEIRYRSSGNVTQ